MKVEEEFRKLQFTGRASYIISLPKKWVDKKGLRQGDQIAIKIQEDSLVLTPSIIKYETKSNEATISVNRADSIQMVSRRMIALYLIGYDKIHIKLGDETMTAKQVTVLKDIIHRTFIGAETIIETEKGITFQILLDTSHFPVENAVQRMVALITSMIEEIISMLESIDKNKLKDIITSDEEINRFSFYVIRQLKMSINEERLVREIGLEKQKECLGYRIEVKNLERIANSLVNIAKWLLHFNKQEKENLILINIRELTSASNKLFLDVMEAHSKRDYNLADNTISKTFELEKIIAEIRLFTLNSEQNTIEKLVLIGIVDEFKQIISYCREIAEVLLNRTIEESKLIRIGHELV